MPVAAFCPCPPLLVDGLTGGDVAPVLQMREACRAAVAELLADRPDAVTLIGPDPALAPSTVSLRLPAQTRGTLAGFGAPGTWRTAGGQPGDDVTGVAVPLALTVGRWLLDLAGFEGRVEQVAVAAGATTADCLRLGSSLATDALLVMGDGSFCRGEKPPGGSDPRAAEFDAGVAKLLAGGSPAGLAALDVDLATELGAAGRSVWQVLAGWVGDREVTAARLCYDDAPFGVGYLVGTWSLPAPQAT